MCNLKSYNFLNLTDWTQFVNQNPCQSTTLTSIKKNFFFSPNIVVKIKRFSVQRLSITIKIVKISNMVTTIIEPQGYLYYNLITKLIKYQ